MNDVTSNGDVDVASSGEVDVAPSGDVDAVPAAEEPSFFRLVATLGIAGLLSGLLLVGVFLVTKDRIKANEKARIQTAVCSILTGEECDEDAVAQMTIVVMKREGTSLVLFDETDTEVSNTDLVYLGYGTQDPSDENFLGYAVYGEGFGFQDTIKVLYGYDPSGQVIVGIEILGHAETPGLGDKIVFDPDWLANFDALAVEPDIEGTKTGRSAPNEVDVITGATISSNAVIAILNSTNDEWLPLLPENPSEIGE